MAGGDDLRRLALPADLERLLHDLRGPLNAVVMHLEVLKRVLVEDPAVHPSLHSIHQELERLAAMLPLAFAVCAVELGRTRRLAVPALIEAAVEETERKRVRVDPGPWPDVEGDERLLVMAIRQLLVNALEAGAGETDVRVSAEAGADSVTIVVRDWGGGFTARSPAAAMRLMGSTKPGHHGIGLIVAQRIARLHGGALSVETSRDGGVARLTLRAVRGSPPAAAG